MRLLAAALAGGLFLAACNPASLTFERVEGNRYLAGTGGVVQDEGRLEGIVSRMVREADASAEPIICDGEMISAHAWGFATLFARGDAVWTERCELVLHAASDLKPYPPFLVPLPDYTREMGRMWHPAIREWFFGRALWWDWIGGHRICGDRPDDPSECDAWLRDLVPDHAA